MRSSAHKEHGGFPPIKNPRKVEVFKKIQFARREFYHLVTSMGGLARRDTGPPKVISCEK